MNNARRAALRKVINALDAIRDQLNDLAETLEVARDGERGQAISEAACA